MTRLEEIVRGVKTGIITGAVLYSAYAGAKAGIDHYTNGLDRPALLLEQGVRVERLHDGRTHIYEWSEKHQYLPPAFLMPQAQKEEEPAPREPGIHEQQQQQDNPILNT